MLLSELFERCLNIPYFQTGKSANYAFERKDEEMYIYFEKSDGENDWRINLDFPSKPYKRMGKTVWFAHRGFLDVWKVIEPKLTEDILNPKIKNFTVTGYSHGAAVALLCHEYIWYNRPELRHALKGYGFGCPRVIHGSTKNCGRRWENFTVIRNKEDIVTHLPPAALGYVHVGKMLEIGKKGRYTPIDAHRSENILKELKRYEADEKSYTVTEILAK